MYRIITCLRVSCYIHTVEEGGPVALILSIQLSLFCTFHTWKQFREREKASYFNYDIFQDLVEFLRDLIL